MANVADVATYILESKGSMTAMKLQKLVYYSQAWHLVWEDRPLFSETIEAWANGPVAPALYSQHRGVFMVDELKGDLSQIEDFEKTSIDAVLEHYGSKTSYELSELTHRESPWLQARDGAAAGARSTKEISLGSMQEYYSALLSFDDGLEN